MSLRADAREILLSAIRAADPGRNTAEILSRLDLTPPVTVFAVGKAAVPMAAAAADALGGRIRRGLVVTKYGHAGGFSAPRFEVIEAAHPVSDENSVRAAERALALADGLTAGDTALVLLSGGGSALFEKSRVPAATQREITEKLLARGAAIDEINAVRKRLSLVKGGGFAARCYPARVVTVALSDVLSDDPGVIASGPTVPDETPDGFVRRVWETYLYDVPAAPPPAAERAAICDGGFYFAGNIRMLCDAAAEKARALGYETALLTERMTGEAREQPAKLLAAAAAPGKRAYICGGETTVTLRGTGKGGRNQEMALAAALLLEGRAGIVFASAGSDGTDGPTDAAGGFADGGTCARIRAAGLDPAAMLENNDSYAALLAAGDLLVTGPTGTNVNDLTLVLTDGRSDTETIPSEDRNMEKKVCCLTGATGHVGYAILKELQDHPEKEVRILVRKDPGYFEGLRCEMVKGDITDYESLIRAFEGVDIVYHVAGCVEIKPGNEDFVYNVNVNGTKNVIRACRKMGVKRLVYMSSVDTYVPLPDNEVMHEVYHYDPDELEGTYAKTKAEATQCVLDANGRDGLETVVCQPSACMGPYDFKVSSVGSMIRMFSSGHFPITMTFGGYNFVDVRDVAKGTVAAGDLGGAGEVYILCNDSCTVDEFIRLLAEVCGNKPPRIRLGKRIIDFAAPIMEGYYKAAKKPAIFTRYAVRKLCSNCNFSYEKAARELGYAPRPLRESLEDTVAWIRETEGPAAEEKPAAAEEKPAGTEEKPAE